MNDSKPRHPPGPVNMSGLPRGWRGLEGTLELWGDIGQFWLFCTPAAAPRVVPQIWAAWLCRDALQQGVPSPHCMFMREKPPVSGLLRSTGPSLRLLHGRMRAGPFRLSSFPSSPCFRAVLPALSGAQWALGCLLGRLHFLGPLWPFVLEGLPPQGPNPSAAHVLPRGMLRV